VDMADRLVDWVLGSDSRRRGSIASADM